jgi:hypothetical protein
MLTQALIFYDGHEALRAGDTGRLEKAMDMKCVMFQGIPKFKNYRIAMFDAKARRAKEWTPEMRELFLMNCVVNISGREDKFLAIDEFNEWLIKGIKFIWNPSANFRSEHHTREVVSPNIMSLRKSIAAVMKTITASTGGMRRTRADDRADIRKLLRSFLEEEMSARFT